MTETTIIYYTDDTIKDPIKTKVLDNINSMGLPVVMVSNEGVERSHIQLFKNILKGAKQATTKYVALAEHDCLYTKEHFSWIPLRDDLFYYNINHWFVEWPGGMYSFQRRKVLSQLICNRDLLLEACANKIEMLETGAKIKRGVAGACEFGVCDNRETFIEDQKICKDLGKDINNYRAKAFATKLPNLDIRHGGNFSGARKAKRRRYWLEPWGSFHKVMGRPPFGTWYQEFEDCPTKRNKDTSEKRWNKFIKPFVDGGGGTVVDLGCNTGFYCKKFEDLGYKVIGVERDVNHYKKALYRKGIEGSKYEIINDDINNYEVPTCSIALLANVHYWLTPEQLEDLIDKLSEKAKRVIIVGRHKYAPQHKTDPSIETIGEYFGGRPTVIEDDGKHYSFVAENPDLIEMDTDELFGKQQFVKSKKFLPAYNELIDIIMSCEDYKMEDTAYYKYLEWRKFKNKKKLFDRHVDLVYDMELNGIREPLLVGRWIDDKYDENRLKDGDHRLIVAKKLGIKKVICKRNNSE